MDYNCLGRVEELNNRSEIEKILTERIINGEYEVGDTLRTERELADEFGVSKTVIHEVILSMRTKGLLSNRTGTRNQVSSWVEDANIYILQALLMANMESPSLDIVSSFAEFRIFNEGKCAALAAQNRTEADLVKLGSCIEKIENASSREDFAEELTMFHHLIFNATGNKLYAILFGTFHKLMVNWTYQMFPDWKDYDVRTLRTIYGFIRDQNAIKAECLMTAHATKSSERLDKLGI